MNCRAIFVAIAIVASSTASAKPVEIKRDSRALEFSYVWSSEAAEISALDTRFRTDMEKAFKEANSAAKEDQRLARDQNRDFNPHFYAMKWATSGQTTRLLSLKSEFGSFSGGAHPNSSYGALLWDRQLQSEVILANLFTRPTDFAALTQATYCKKLDAERKKRRNGEKIAGDFAKCPKFSELAIAPVDKNKNGSFDEIVFTASPYVAGPYTEGQYEISVPVTAKIIAALKTEYRTSFESQRQ